MELGIYAGKRVLYKDGNSGWLVGIVKQGNAEVNEKGVWVQIIPLRFIDEKEEDIPYVQWAEINTLYTESQPLENWMMTSLFPKEEYIKIIEDDEFEKNLESAWVSDGEYYYYPVNKFSESWIRKQPFNYILRGN